MRLHEDKDEFMYDCIKSYTRQKKCNICIIKYYISILLTYGITFLIISSIIKLLYLLVLFIIS